ncbi:MAG: 16S rRNA (adenine(1518)-N(6)/adenine(1519)-N(6))-dimethyltransferase RsmA [Alphaproteobacteria bacterium]|nr:16S rRNA (adenine(1518)-N(6)/adenine(1519)-N(6))-dimethyltransferase RsmA [Alphaproteobacteria bacterium]
MLSLPPLRDAIAAAGLSAKKSLGQNFLLDLNLTRRIARAAGLVPGGLETGTTIEIGPGPGGLTRALLIQGATKLVAVERDERAITALSTLVEASDGRLELVCADALDVDPEDLGPAPRRIVANLPYNVGTRLLLNWLETPEQFASFTLMFQREVAERLVAPTGGEAYGRLSVLAQWLCRVKILFDVPATAFTPPPKIKSSVVQLIPREAPLAPADRADLERVTAAAFAQRRKMLRQSLKGLGGDALLERAGIKPTERPEQLSIEDFCRIANAL